MALPAPGGVSLCSAVSPNRPPEPASRVHGRSLPDFACPTGSPDDQKLTAIIEREDDGYVALCPEVDVVSRGDTVAEARANLEEALTLFFETAPTEEIEGRLREEVYVTHVEKGIDVRIAIDLITLAYRREYDVAVVFSQDQDLSEVAIELRRISREQNRWIQMISASPTIRQIGPAVGSRRRRGSGSTRLSTTRASIRTTTGRLRRHLRAARPREAERPKESGGQKPSRVSAGTSSGSCRPCRAPGPTSPTPSRARARGGGRPGQLRWRNALVVAQLTISLVLLVGAGLFLCSFQ